MIVSSMDEPEWHKEISSDVRNAVNYAMLQQSKFRQQVMKATRFPVYSRYDYVSPKKNKWLILLEARNKNEVGRRCRITYVLTHTTGHGIYAFWVPLIKSDSMLIVYPPHFFVRYRDRAKINKTGINLIAEYFRYNTDYTYKMFPKEVDTELYDVYMAASSADGIALGMGSKNGNMMCKTFITYDMLKGEQLEIFSKREQMRLEIHSDTDLPFECLAPLFDERNKMHIPTQQRKEKTELSKK